MAVLQSSTRMPRLSSARCSLPPSPSGTPPPLSTMITANPAFSSSPPSSLSHCLSVSLSLYLSVYYLSLPLSLSLSLSLSLALALPFSLSLSLSLSLILPPIHTHTHTAHTRHISATQNTQYVCWTQTPSRPQNSRRPLPSLSADNGPAKASRPRGPGLAPGTPGVTITRARSVARSQRGVLVGGFASGVDRAVDASGPSLSRPGRLSP